MADMGEHDGGRAALIVGGTATPSDPAAWPALDADAVWVSKPRLPSYLLGIEAKRARNRPLVLDVDDHELAFFAEDTALALGDVHRLADELLQAEAEWLPAFT